MNGAESLVAQLEALGVDVVFGIPGVHNLAIFDALSRSKKIRTVVVRHEQAAGYAADGYARATGKIGVAVVTTGPGTANAAASMGEARAARSPVLLIGTQLDTRSLEGRAGRFQLHESPKQLEMMRAVTRWAGRVQKEDAVAQMIVRAAKEAFAGRRGPVFVEIPFDVLSAEVSSPEVVQDVPLYRAMFPEPGPISRAADRLEHSKQPVIWAGGGVISAGATKELQGVAELLDAPVVTTFNGKGAMPADHPLTVGLPPHQEQVTELIQKSDAVLIVGSDLDGPSTQGWRLSMPRPRVGINVVGEDARRNYACDVLIESDARTAMEALCQALTPSSRKGAARVAAVRKEALAKLKRLKESKEPFAFVNALHDALPAETFVLADMAIAGYWAAGFMPVDGPRRFAYPLGWGTLGFALPASVGVAATGRRAVVVCGDAGFLFAPGELATLVQENLPVTIVVVDDAGYGMLRFDQKERFGKLFAVDLVTPDFVKLAASFGVKGRSVKPAEIGKAVAWAVKVKGPSLIHVAAKWAPPVTTSPRWPLKGRPELRP